MNMEILFRRPDFPRHGILPFDRFRYRRKSPDKPFVIGLSF
jgi:hypothetical protein